MTTTEAMPVAVRPLRGTVAEPFVARIPGSKSLTNRALVLAALRMGRTRVEGALHSDDTELLARALDAFGGLSARRSPTGYVVERTAERLSAPAGPLFMGAAGTPARLMIAFAAAADGTTEITGTARLCERPMGDLIDALRAAGIGVRCLAREGCLPVRVEGGPVAATRWSVRGGISSQFTTALVMLAVQQERGPIRIDVEGHLVSRPYAEMTVKMLRAAGVEVRFDGPSRIIVEPEPIASRRLPDRLDVEPDASGMSYFLGAAALTGTSVLVPGVGRGSTQGDVGFARVLEQMGCTVRMDADSVFLRGGRLGGLRVDMERMPDMVLTLAAVAAGAGGPTVITNVANLRLKECDRIHAAVTELRRLGVRAEGTDDSITVEPSGAIGPAVIRTYDDHRVAMSFAMLGTSVPGISIEDPGCVAKSFPGFWEELERWRAHHEGVDA